MTSPWPRAEGRPRRAEWWQRAPCQRDQSMMNHRAAIHQSATLSTAAKVQRVVPGDCSDSTWLSRPSPVGAGDRHSPKLQSQNTSGVVTQVNAQGVTAPFPQDSSSPLTKVKLPVIQHCCKNHRYCPEYRISHTCRRCRVAHRSGDLRTAVLFAATGASQSQSPRPGLGGVSCCL